MQLVRVLKSICFLICIFYPSNDLILKVTAYENQKQLNKDYIDIQKGYRKTSHISRTLAGNRIVDNSDVVGASPVGAAPTTSSFST